MPRPVKDQMLGEIVPAYLDWMADQGKAAHTLASTRLDLRQLSRFLGRQTVGSVTPDDLRSFFGWLGRQQGNRPSSLRRKTATVKGLFRHLHARGELPHDPAAELLYPAPAISEQTPLAPDEIEAIVGAAISASWRALILCFVDAGLKRDELVALRCEDVEIVAGADGPGRLHVRHRWASRRVKQRTLGLTQRLADALAVQLGSAQAVTRESVFDLSARGVDFAVEICGRRVGVRPDSKVTPKQLRDAYACARIRAFQTREAEIDPDDVLRLRDLRRQHDALLVRELGLARDSTVPERYRRMVRSLEGDWSKER